MSAATGHIINKYQDVASNRVVNAVKTAAAKTGVDFSFLMEKAATESSFNPNAKSKSSSATGLYQFIESTWLTMVKEHGEKYGLGNLADKITINDSGKACVTDCNVKKQILDLRKSPEISALMAGEFTAANKEYLEAKTDSEVGSTEMYMAHFMGAGGAAKFLNARHDNGQRSAAAMFPDAARANKNVFYDKSGRARTLNEVYNNFDKKFDGTSSPSTAKSASSPDADIACAATSPASSATAAAQAVSSYLATTNGIPDENGIIWFDAPVTTPRATSSHAKVASSMNSSKLSPVNIMTILDMQNPSFVENRRTEERSDRRSTYNT